MNTTCKHCHRDFPWTRGACPFCWQPNSARPTMLIAILLALLLSAAAIHYAMTAAEETTDPAPPVNPPAQGDDSGIKGIFKTPEPPAKQDVDFSR